MNRHLYCSGGSIYQFIVDTTMERNDTGNKTSSREVLKSGRLKGWVIMLLSECLRILLIARHDGDIEYIGCEV